MRGEPRRRGKRLLVSRAELQSLCDAAQVLPVCVLGLRRFCRQNLPASGMVRH